AREEGARAKTARAEGARPQAGGRGHKSGARGRTCRARCNRSAQVRGDKAASSGSSGAGARRAGLLKDAARFDIRFGGNSTIAKRPPGRISMRGLFVLGLGAALALALAMGAVAAGSKDSGFVNYSLAETTGTSCPGSQACSNFAAEPAIRADGA